MAWEADIATLQEANELYTACSWCALLECEAPQKECESLTGDASIDGYAQFTEPEGDPEDDVPSIYATLNTTDESLIADGRTSYYESNTYSPGGLEADEEYSFNVYVNDALTDTGRDYNQIIDGDCSGDASVFPSVSADRSISWGEAVYVEDVDECSATSHETYEKWEDKQGTDNELEGCPGPWGDKLIDFRDMTFKSDYLKRELTDGKTKSQLIEDANGEIPETWPETPEGESCVASAETTWPSISDVAGEGWPECADGPPEAGATVTSTKVRYKFGIPVDYDRSNYDLQWDEVFFPKEWDEWNSGGQVGTEPTPGPSLVASQSWSYTGGSDWSDWFEMGPPTDEGEIRVVNLRGIGYTTKYGMKPTAWGETIEITP